MKSDGLHIWNLLFLTILGLFISACGMTQRGTAPWEEQPTSPEIPEEISYSTPTDDAPENLDAVFESEAETNVIQQRRQFLQLAYNDWEGTPYSFGGSGPGGIDCSAFMQVVFEDYLTKQIPRTTRQQMKAGQVISKLELRTGDLVFFKTGRRSYHVGVMVNRDEFLHASTSQGVKISGLDHPYWQETWLTARRLF